MFDVTIDIPQRLASLPLDDKGRPVPYFVAWLDGRPDFRVADPAKYIKCVNEKRCWLCGEKLGSALAFVIGPMCAINRTTAEPPSHFDCAEFAVKACPFLTEPKRKRDPIDLPQDLQSPAGTMIKRNPGVSLIWVTSHYRLFEAGAGILIEVGPPMRTLWYCEGRQATREEVLASIDAGMPLLAAEAQKDGPAGLRQLQHDFEKMKSLLPAEAGHDGIAGL